MPPKNYNELINLRIIDMKRRLSLLEDQDANNVFNELGEIKIKIEKLCERRNKL